MFNSTNATPQVLELYTVIDIDQRNFLHQAVEAPVHFVLAFMIRPQANSAAKLLARYTHGTTDQARALIELMYRPYIAKKKSFTDEDDHPSFYVPTDNMKHMYAKAFELAAQDGSSKVCTDHVLQAIIAEQDEDTDTVLKAIGVYPHLWDIYEELKGTSSTEH